jgi:hypothetical protein
MNPSIAFKIMTHSKIQGKFYALQEKDLKEMKQAGLINNTAYVLLGLKVENPFGDKPIKLIVEDFAARWQLPVVSVYKALARLKQKGQINIETGTLVITLNSDTDYQSGEPIIKIDNELSEPIIHYQDGKKDDPKPLPDKESESSQTIQTKHTPQTKDGGDDDQIPEAILNRIKRLGIYFDKRIKEAIANSSRSQIENALSHIENTSQSIRSRYGVFLYQLSLKEENSAPGDVFRNFPEGFLDWYNKNRGDLLEDIEPQFLPRDRYGEPQVRLKSRPRDLVEWRRVSSGEDSEENSLSLKESLERIAPCLRSRLGFA